MLRYKAFQAGASTQLAAAMSGDCATGLTATGTTQADAYAMNFGKCAFSTVAAGTGAILSSNAGDGDSQLVFNGGANPLKVYPPSGAQINQLGTNAPALLPVQTPCEFHRLSTTLWTGVLSA